MSSQNVRKIDSLHSHASAANAAHVPAEIERLILGVHSHGGERQVRDAFEALGEARARLECESVRRPRDAADVGVQKSFARAALEVAGAGSMKNSRGCVNVMIDGRYT
jgi:hypothetical protein